MNKLYTLAAVATLAASSFSSLQAEENKKFSQQAFEDEQYDKALWMTTRFYGAQRSGWGPNWVLANHEPTNVAANLQQYVPATHKGISYIKDADTDGYDLVGGWWDCADFVKFGHTNYYSAYMLLLGYSEFPQGYKDLYSADYNGYIGSDNYSWEGKAGIPNGIPDILDEVKYATDYFMKCIRSEKQFYFQVGEGDPDHKIWCTAVMKAGMPLSLGGELEGSRAVYSTRGRGTSMVAFCGATLAAMSRLYRPYDAAYADKCLEKAKVCYSFIRNLPIGNIGTGDGKFYGVKPTYESDCIVFCMEMYRATGDKQYVDDLYDEEEGYTAYIHNSKKWSHWYTLGYNNTEDLGYYLLGNYAGDTLAQNYFGQMMNMYKPANGYILNVKNNKWGMLRYPANQAFMYGLHCKMKVDQGIDPHALDDIDPYALASIEYIMGSNSENFSFITGFGENSPKAPHYRNIYLDDSNDMARCKISEKHAQLGYMVGGSFNPIYADNINNYETGEGGIDYNAGLVGALGYINSFVNPTKATNNKSDNVECFLYPNPAVDFVALRSNESGKALVTISNIEGQIVKMFNTTWEALQEGVNVASLQKGTYVISVNSAKGNASKKFVKK